MTRHIGPHVSIAGGLHNAPARAAELGATAMGIFTKNQRQWRSPPLTEDTCARFSAALGESGIRPEHVLVHSSYLINVANPDPEKWARAVDALTDEALRVEKLGLSLLNFHPGSGLGAITEDEALSLVSDAVLEVLGRTASAVLVLETTAGQGSNVGHTFDQLARIVEGAGGSDRIGVCIDTCHIFAAGYNLRSAAEYSHIIDEFSSSVGLDRLRGIHLNDSRSELGSRHDRHESIGAGEIGLEGLARLVTDERIPDVPFILETPRPEIWADEISTLSAIAK